MNLHIKYKSLLEKYDLNTLLRKAHFFAQIGHESGFISQRENLYYTTIKGLCNTFKSPFKEKSDAFVSQYLRNPEKCANYVYANRMGNGNEASGDGWKYRGGGYLQNTGKKMYEWLTNKTGIDFINQPNLILIEANSLIAALEYWKVNNLNILADEDNIDAISDIINIGKKTKSYGDSNGFAHRKKLLAYYKTQIK
jgi:putative chitinase